MKISQAISGRLFRIIKRLGSFEEPIQAGRLEDVMFLRGEAVRNYVMDMRRNGLAVASDHRGYWIAQNKVELASTIEQMKSRVESLVTTLEALDKTFGALPEAGRK